MPIDLELIGGYRSSIDYSRLTIIILFCHSIIFKVVLFIATLINVPFLITFTNVILGFPLPYFVHET